MYPTQAELERATIKATFSAASVAGITGCCWREYFSRSSPYLLLAIRPLFPYIAAYEYLPQVLHRLLQEMRT
jgi:hypothetical protein